MARAPTTKNTSGKRPVALAPRSRDDARVPVLGLVCVTAGPEIRYRTITRTRFLSLDETAQAAALNDVYGHNVRILFSALDFCDAGDIRLYRVTSNLFPQVDHPVGRGIRESFAPRMAGFGARAAEFGIRVVMHPDQWVVLNSDTPAVVEQSVAILADHARTFDLLDLPRSPWSMLLVHGGKGNRSDALVKTIGGLPPNIRARLALENDESCYSAQQILDVCRKTNVPMVFDAHHHVVREKLETYEHPGVREMTTAAGATWDPHPEWQIVHISNGLEQFGDPRHSDLIDAFPTAFFEVPWVEVEAKGKENAIMPLRKRICRH